MRDLVGWDRSAARTGGNVWRPTPLSKDNWPPDYEGVYRWRTAMLERLRRDPAALTAARAYYSTRPVEFILDWLDTYDPRREGNKWIPFVFFEKQREFIEFLQSLDRDQESGLVEKTRDMGATWAACGYSLWCWLFQPGDSTGWGSRKEDLVDQAGNADSIFEKIRLMLKRMPGIWMPEGFIWNRHSSHMKLVNPSNGAIISGEAGDNIGRGGRKSRYFKDEAAHYERPEKIEAALGDNTNVQIDISSVNGLGNVFHRRREHGVIWQKGMDIPKGFVRVFIMDWRDHPNKTQDWYDARKAKFEREGMAHVFAQEVDRNYAAALSNVVIEYQWIQAAVDAHIHIPYVAEAYQQRKDQWVAGLDVADGGNDRNSLSLTEWIIWRHCEEWGERDPGITARKAMVACRPHLGKITVQYDSIGVGAAVKTEYNRLTLDEQLDWAQRIPFTPWNAGAKVVKPFERIVPDDDESLMNKDFFENLKAQGWWSLRTRFFKTWKARTEGAVYPADELISLDSRMPLLAQLMKELAQPTRGQSTKLRLLINKTPEGTRSPNLADGGMMAYFPLDGFGATAESGYYGN